MEYIITSWDALSEQISDYLASLNGRNDAFHHDMLFGGKPYFITENEQVLGFFSLSDGWDGGQMLCGFYLPNRTDSDVVFKEILDKYDICAALVPSNDNLYITVAMERMRQCDGSFEIQAYQYTYGLPNRAAEYNPEDIAPVDASEYDEMNRLTDGQWDVCFDDPRFRFYALRHDGVTLGYGAICPLLHQDNYADIGNFTLPQYRRRGVGRSILIHLALIVKSQNQIPIAGCWAGNKESIPTLKSAGFIPENRIFYVKFK